ncbi:E3 ubiquitin-protein ligase RFWD3 isoform X1 [Achlya hypogyna]|uniref:RING-type E3 ubiquitin transferase n=1 Tax=Achlya hypogyna TaxID=1202772 RepID=A0A1V9ZS64_ACHHY|nr:E3 ubiquitin-protein ligase RFWD3 isoform X1 [Achlya hypogyna]
MATSPTGKKRRRESLEALECTICCELCTTHGGHRLASLACGHFFGQSCIERWVKTSKTCPICNRAVKRNDVRIHFTDTIAAVDNSLQEEYNQKYLHEKQARTQAEMEVARLKLQLGLAQQEVETQKQRIMELLSENSRLKARPIELSDDSDDSDDDGPTVPATSDNTDALPLEYIRATATAIPCIEARVCAFSSTCDMVCVGTRTHVSTVDVHHRVAVPLHKSPVRDLSISHDDALVATTAFDAKLHFTSTKSHSSVLRYDLPFPGWSCTWDVSNPYRVFCGHHNGQISVFDIRRTGAPVQTLQHQLKQPVHAVRTMQHGGSTTVVAATFSGVSMWLAADGATLEPEPSLNMEVANCFAMQQNQVRPTQLVVSTRSQQAHPAQHFVVSVGKTATGALETVSDVVLQGHRTPSALSRSALWHLPHQGSPVVASADDASQQVWLWATASGAVVRKLSPGLPSAVVDVQHGIVPSIGSEQGWLALLSKEALVLYKTKAVAKAPRSFFSPVGSQRRA